jgi:NitT/TauT family transport system ATP-binding protein
LWIFSGTKQRGGVPIILKIDKLQKKFYDLPVIENLNLEVGPREITAVIGPSGCGKSTMLNIITGLTDRDGGVVERGCDRFGYVFQEDRLLPWLSVYDNIRIVNDFAGRAEITRLIRDVGLEGFEAYYPHKLSGGMRQRCAIARAFNYRCELLLMDEPFKSLDYSLRLEMLTMLVRIWQQQENAILFITHEIDEALTIANRIVVLKKRPTCVIDEFCLGVDNGARDIYTENILQVKREIIRLIA